MAALFRGPAGGGAVDPLRCGFGEPKCRVWSRHPRDRSRAVPRPGAGRIQACLPEAASRRHRRLGDRRRRRVHAADLGDDVTAETGPSDPRRRLPVGPQCGRCRGASGPGSAAECAPLFHAHGLISGLLAALAAGSSVVCPPKFDAADFFGWLKQCRPTWYTAVPPIHRALISAARRRKRSFRQSSLRLIRSASSSLPIDVLDELEALFGVPVIETYGMTEAATQIAANPVERRKPGSVGIPAGPEIAVMDSEGRHLPAGEHGEVALRGPTITRGYD